MSGGHQKVLLIIGGGWSECPVWTAVLDMAARNHGGALPAPEQAVRWQDEFVRPTDTRRLLTKSVNEICEVTGARVVVHSSDDVKASWVYGELTPRP